MFKKNVVPSSTHQLSGKDAKELRRTVAKQHPRVTEEELAALLPPKAALSMTKLSNRAVVWGLEGGNPLFFDPDGRGAVLPTVYTLALLPHMVDTLHTWSEVSPKVLGGADLFLQGVLAPPGGVGDFLAGSVRALGVPGNPAPFAIGRMAVSKAEAVREQMKGRGLTVLHTYGDLLWQMGDKQPPNAGFTPRRIFPLETDGGAAAGGSVGGDEADAADDAAAALGALAVSRPGSAEAAEGPDTAPEPAGAAAGEGGDGAGAAGAAPPADMDMDTLLEHAVLAGLQTLTNASLPIMTSDFYTKHMVPAKPEGVVFDMKASKYKKLSKLLDKFEKDKVITQKQIRKQDHITAVNRSHSAYTSFEGAGGAAVGGGGAKNGAAPPSGSKAAAGGASAAPRLQVAYCWRVPSSLRPVFEAGGAGDKDRLYSREEVVAALNTYAQAGGLAEVVGGRPCIKLDRLLLGIFSRKEELSEGQAVPADAVATKLLDKLQQFHRLLRPGESGQASVEVVRKGAVRPVGVAAERRHGRSVTVVTRVESFALSPEELAGTLQRKFQTSCTVSKLPGKEEKDHELMLQGDLVKAVAAFLTESFGIPSDFLEVKTAAKKK